MSSHRPSVDSENLSQNPSRHPLYTLFEKQGLKSSDVKSAPTSRRPSVSQSVSDSRRPSASSSRRPSISSSVASSRRDSIVTDNLENKPPPPKPSSPSVPACPDLDHPPYAKPLGSAFQGDEWTPLFDRLDDRVIKVINVCQSVAINLNMPVEDISWTGLHYNILALDDLTIAEITRDCWMIIYEIIGKGYEWTALLEEHNIVARVKRNLRQSQPQIRWEVACDTMISLGFTDKWLYE